MTARLIMKMCVAEAHTEPGDVRVLTLRHPWRARLAEPSPGAHVDLRLPDGKIRQYSLCGDPDDASQYRIAVKREEEGRGGSRWVHNALDVGGEVHVSTPRNNFPLADGAPAHILIAGGIGITPFLAMARRLSREGANFQLHYGTRHLQPPFLDELQAVCPPDVLNVYTSSGPAPRRIDIDAVLRSVPEGAHVYCCGPERLTSAVREATRSWPTGRVHFEVFQPTVDDNFNPEPFDVTIRSTGQTFRIPADRSALDVLRDAGFALPSSCELGVCGACECGYTEGTVIHRDSVLPVSARQDRMMLCVSRARVKVTLDL